MEVKLFSLSKYENRSKCEKLLKNSSNFNNNSIKNVEIKKETQELRPKSKVKSENYIHIPGWAVCELGLKGNELLIYAIIFGFSQEENQTFRGSLRYLMDWTNSTKATVINVLKSLTKKGLIEKKEKIINGVKFCEYCVTRFKNEDSPIKPVVKNLYQGGIKIIPNILDNNIGTNSINRISNKYIRAKDCASVLIEPDTESKNNKCADAHPLIENKNTVPLSTSKNKALRKSKPKLAPKVLKEEFNTVWDLYPKKKDKTRAFKAFSKARIEGVPLEKIREGVQKYVHEIENTGIAHQYIKYGSTWFNNRCWEDEYDTNTKSSYDLDEYVKAMDTFSSEPQKPPERLGLWL